MDLVEVLEKLKETRDTLKDVEKARDLSRDIEEAIEDLESHLEEGTEPDMVEVFTKIGKAFELAADLIPVPVMDQFIGAYGEAMQAAMSHADTWDSRGFDGYRQFRDGGMGHREAIQISPARPDRETAEDWRRCYELGKLEELVEAKKKERGEEAAQPAPESTKPDDGGTEKEYGSLSDFVETILDLFDPIEAGKFYWSWIAGLLVAGPAEQRTRGPSSFPLSACVVPLALAAFVCGGFGGLYIWRGMQQGGEVEGPVVTRPQPVDYTDWDGDQVRDQEDNCPLMANPGQNQLAGREFGLACDDDPDGDSVPNIYDPNPFGVGAWEGSASPAATLLNPDAIRDPSYSGPGLLEVVPFGNVDAAGPDLLNLHLYPATSAPLELASGGEIDLVIEVADFEAHLDCTGYPQVEGSLCEGYALSRDEAYACWGASDDAHLDVSCHVPSGSAAGLVAGVDRLDMRIDGGTMAAEFSWLATVPEGSEIRSAPVDAGSDCVDPNDSPVPCSHEYGDVQHFDVSLEMDDAGQFALLWTIETGEAVPEDGSLELTLIQTLENRATQERNVRMVYFYPTGNQWTYSGATLDGATTIPRFQLPEASLVVNGNRIEIRQEVEGSVVPRVSWGGWLFDYETQAADYAADEFPNEFFEGMTPGWGLDFPNERDPYGVLFTRPMRSSVHDPLQAFKLEVFTEDGLDGLTHDCPFGNLDQIDALQYVFWFRQRPEGQGTCASGTMFSASNGEVTYGEPWSGPNPQNEPWFKMLPGINLVSVPEPEPSAVVERSGAYIGSTDIKSDPGGHRPFGWPIGEVEFDVLVDGNDITIAWHSSWTFTGQLDEQGNLMAMGTGTFAGYGGVQATLEGRLTQLTGLEGLITVGTNQRLPGGQPITYNLTAERAGTVISDSFDASSGIGTQTVDLDGDGQADLLRRYDADGQVTEERPLDQGDEVTAGTFDAQSGIETKWIDLDGDGQPDVIRRYDRQGDLIEEEGLVGGEVVEVSFDASSGNTTQWIDEDGDGQSDLVRILGPGNEVIEEMEVDGARIEVVVSESFDAATGSITQTIDTDGDGRADVLRTVDGEGQLIHEVDLEATEGGLIVSEAYDAESGTTTRTVDLDADGTADVLQIYDENDELIVERQLDVDGEAVVISETHDADSGTTTRTVDIDGDGEADLIRTYDRDGELIEEEEPRGLFNAMLGAVFPLVVGAGCLSVVVLLGLVALAAIVARRSGAESSISDL